MGPTVERRIQGDSVETEGSMTARFPVCIAGAVVRFCQEEREACLVPDGHLDDCFCLTGRKNCQCCCLCKRKEGKDNRHKKPTDCVKIFFSKFRNQNKLFIDMQE
ncbi:unnamed protein product [Thelazia callipaeda]|uniref:Disintegrin domain-containing protein n=1 Tax=Thelazia callipaeda TaxID=103827 RepID=A0A0N5CU27_THECL|nr:unnamed protein product [Thelazia callipaeda]